MRGTSLKRLRESVPVLQDDVSEGNPNLNKPTVTELTPGIKNIMFAQ